MPRVPANCHCGVCAQLRTEAAGLRTEIADQQRQIEHLKACLPLGHDTVPEWMVQEAPALG